MSFDTRNPRRLPAHRRRELEISRADLELRVFAERRYAFIQSALAIPNEAGASFRSDNNTALQAVANFSAGASAPGTTYAYQPWADTTTNTLKRRNAANSSWIVAWSLDESFVLSRSTNTILGLSDYAKTIIATSNFTQTLTAAATLGDGWFCWYRNDGTGVITIDPNASETIDGATTLALQPGQACRIACNGSAFKTQGLTQFPQNAESLRVIRGNINSGGIIANGTGFSAVRNSAGNYTITYTTAFNAAPTVIVTINAGAGTINGTLGGFSFVGSCNIQTFVGATATDEAFGFVAIGP